PRLHWTMAVSEAALKLTSARWLAQAGAGSTVALSLLLVMGPARADESPATPSAAAAQPASADRSAATPTVAAAQPASIDQNIAARRPGTAKAHARPYTM